MIEYLNLFAKNTKNFHLLIIIVLVDCQRVNKFTDEAAWFVSRLQLNTSLCPLRRLVLACNVPVVHKRCVDMLRIESVGDYTNRKCLQCSRRSKKKERKMNERNSKFKRAVFLHFLL